MNFLLLLIFFGNTDSLVVDSQASIQSKSIMFQTKEASKVRVSRYQHTQGFFCDFEDKINKGKKINLNVGVGKQ